jgi:NAD(P)-dependent dehydrogenase (short-subunit alcohol dehydrogenase family)
MSNVWLVTGSARGLGRSIAEAVLSAGDRLVATARDPQRLADLVDRYGDRIRPVTLDVTDPAAAREAVQVAVNAFGRLDVLVNNAGFGHLSPFEQSPDDDFRAQIDTNFYGVVNVTRAALPVMRQQRSGHIIQISSIGGRIGTPGLSAYQAAKWAVGGFSEVLRQEVEPIGIKVTILEPGGMKTDWGMIARGNVPDILPDYKPAFEQMLGLMRQYVGNETGDPVKVADLIVRLANHDKAPLHLLLGSDAVHIAELFGAARETTDKAWREVSISTDFTASATPPALPETAPVASLFALFTEAAS